VTVGPWRRRPIAVAGVLAVLVGALGMGIDVGAETTSQQRDRIRRERAQAAAELNVLQAEDAEVDAALDAMTAEVSAQELTLAAAEDAASVAEEDLAAAQTAEATMIQRVTQLEGTLRDMAVQEFITGSRLKIDLFKPEGDDLSDWARRNALADFAIGSATVTNNELREAQQDLMVARQDAERAAAEAAQHRIEAEAQLDVVSAARDQQAAFAQRLDDRIESRLAEANHLSALDSQLSARLAAEQAALAARNRGRRASTGGGRSVGTGNVRLRTVNGITVAESIADNLAALLSQASTDGVELSGWGYRNPEDQRRLREQHCPDPVNSPSYACRPPTARPGHSMHERGLAIDFTYEGRTVSSGSVAYRWLRANAGRYGLQNLPGEPWHWSTNGN
jgi:LAS superfamily LD-carboxypeptidase LdcB